MHRAILRLALVLLGLAALVAACSSRGDQTAPRESPCYVGPVRDVSIPAVPSMIHPARVDASKFQTATPIKHVVFIMKENRTFDNLFGAFPGADGASTGTLNGKTVSLRSHCFAQVLPKDIKHDFPSAIEHLNEGKMDKFGTGDDMTEWAYTQAQEKDIPNYWHWARTFAISDNFFASVLGPSFPNHLYALGKTAHGTNDNPVPVPDLGASQVIEDQDRLGGVTAKSWGCDAPTGTYVLRDVRHRNFQTREYPCFDIPVVPDALKEAGIPWAFYGSTSTQPGYIWVSPNSIEHIRLVPTVWESHVFGVDQLIPDIREGRLPPVTWVTPPFWLSDHPDTSICYGENWTTEVVNAIMESGMWKDTAIFISWDDWGGFYDHVVPPERLGFRVPTMTLSPYAKSGFIDSTQGDFSSILNFIEHNWNLKSTGRSLSLGNDMAQNFDFGQAPLPPDPLPLRRDCQDEPGSATDVPFDPN